MRQLQEKHLAAGKLLYLAFVDLEKAFNRVLREVIWCEMRKLGVGEWLVRVARECMHTSAFGCGLTIHHGSRGALAGVTHGMPMGAALC